MLTQRSMFLYVFLTNLLLSSPLFAQAVEPPAPVDEELEPELPLPEEGVLTPQPTKPADQKQVSAVESEKAQTEYVDSNTQRPDPVSLNAKAGIGSSFDPATLWFTAEFEAQLDKFLAIGPRFQFGSGSDTDYVFITMGPRLVLPIQVMEIGFHNSFGLAYRNVNGFKFNDLMYQVGFNADIYLSKNISVGAAYTFNIITSPAEQYMTALTGTVAAHF